MARHCYWVWGGDEWSRPSRASRTSKGWLHAEFRDGANMLIQPKNFTVSEKKPTQPPAYLLQREAKP